MRASKDHTIRLWNPHTGKPLQTLWGHTGAVYDLAFDTTGKQLWSASEDQTIRRWSLLPQD